MNKLAEYTKNYVLSNGYKLQFIANKLGVTRQYLNILFNKKSFGEDDANRILECIQKKIDIQYSVTDFIKHIEIDKTASDNSNNDNNKED